MQNRTRLFLATASGALVIGLGTALVASYGVQNLPLLGNDGRAELAYIPADSRLVAYANVRDLMGSELRQRFTQLAPDKDQTARDRFQADTGIDIERDIEHVVAALPAVNGGATKQRPLVVARGFFDQVRIEGLIREHGGTATEYEGVRLVTDAESELAVAFASPGVVVVGEPAAVRRALATKKRGTGNVTENADVMRLVRGVDQGNAWMVANFDGIARSAALPPMVSDQLPPISWFAASGQIDGGVRATISAETRDERAADDLKDVIRGFTALARMQAGRQPAVAEVLSTLQLGGDGNTVSLEFSLPPEAFDALAQMHARQRAARPPAAPGATAPALPAPAPAQ